MTEARVVVPGVDPEISFEVLKCRVEPSDEF